MREKSRISPVIADLRPKRCPLGVAAFSCLPSKRITKCYSIGILQCILNCSWNSTNTSGFCQIVNKNALAFLVNFFTADCPTCVFGAVIFIIERLMAKQA